MSIRKGDNIIAGNYATTNPLQIDYSIANNKPKINEVELVGNKSLTDIGAASATKVTQIETQLGGVTLVKLTQAQYDALVEADTIDNDTLYVVTPN